MSRILDEWLFHFIHLIIIKNVIAISLSTYFKHIRHITYFMCVQYNT